MRTVWLLPRRIQPYQNCKRKTPATAKPTGVCAPLYKRGAQDDAQLNIILICAVREVANSIQHLKRGNTTNRTLPIGVVLELVSNA